jgi:hypothetical protein
MKNWHEHWILLNFRKWIATYTKISTSKWTGCNTYIESGRIQQNSAGKYEPPARINLEFAKKTWKHIHHPDDGGSTHLWNVGLLQQYYTALYPIRLSSSWTHNYAWRILEHAINPSSWSSTKYYLRIQSVPQREHHTSPLQRSTG